MTRREAYLVGRYLERALAMVGELKVSPAAAGRPAMVCVNGTFVGTVERDEDDGEVSYALTVPILAEDLR